MRYFRVIPDKGNKNNFIRPCRVHLSALFLDPGLKKAEANNCFSIIFRDGYQGPQNSGVKHKNTDAIVRVHTRMQL